MEAMGPVSKPTLSHHSTAPVVSSSGIAAWSWSSVLPKSRTEQYWAARALSAETLLTARTEHQWEIRDLTRYQEERRSTEVAALTKAHDERLAKLEKLIIILIGVLVLFAAALFFVYVTSAPLNPRNDPRGKSFAHFTIPILSPFASVVEHETSTVGAKTILSISMVFATLVYFAFRYWLSSRNIRS